MDGIARLGDLLALADRQLRAAALERDLGPGAPSIAAEISHAADVARTLGRYLDDVLADDLLEIVVNRDAGTRSHAAAQVRYALHMAESSFRAAAGVASAPGEIAEPPAASGLADVVTSLAAGRDLVRTHFSTDPAGIRTPASQWAKVIGSAAFTGALLGYLGRQSRQLGAWAARTCYVTSSEATVSDNVRIELASAQQWLTLASTAVHASARQYPVTAENTLLAALPANLMPPPRPLDGAEPLPVLCEAITVIAERLRLIARWRPAQAARSPLTTVESWRWIATATAVVSDLTEAIAGALAGASHLAVSKQPLATAAQLAADTCASWQHAASTWKYMTTETRGLLAPGLADLGDLVVRLGRLAFADPLWTPGRSRGTLVRPASELAANDAQAAMVLSAVHHAADALAVTAAADQQAVEQVVAADRLYVPARTLPEAFYGRPRPFDLALSEDKYALCDAYAIAAEASARLAAALDVAAVVTGAPSAVLAVARAASRVPLGIEEQALVGRSAAELAERPKSRQPVESAVRRTGMKDPMMLLRAKLLDEAGRQLAAEAAAANGQADRPAAVITARQSFPRLADTSRTGTVRSTRPAANRVQIVDQSRRRGNP